MDSNNAQHLDAEVIVHSDGVVFAQEIFAGSHKPDRSYHSAPSVSPDRYIQAPMASPRIGRQMQGFTGACCFKKSISEPRGIALLKV